MWFSSEAVLERTEVWSWKEEVLGRCGGRK